jgi:hypothetical protein
MQALVEQLSGKPVELGSGMFWGGGPGGVGNPVAPPWSWGLEGPEGRFLSRAWTWQSPAELGPGGA